jgi:hypothetical protein
VGSTCFPVREDSVGSGVVTWGLGGCKRSAPIPGGKDNPSPETSGGGCNAVGLAAGITGCTGAMKLTTGFAGVRRVPQPQAYTAHMLKTVATHRFVVALCLIIPQTSVDSSLVAASCVSQGREIHRKKSAVKSVARFARTDGPNSPLAKLLRGQRQFNAERGSSSNFRCKVDGSIMQLHDTEGTG